MSDKSVDEVMAQLTPIAEKVAASLPPAPPEVYVVVQYETEYNDNYYYPSNPQLYGAYASRAAAKAAAVDCGYLQAADASYCIRDTYGAYTYSNLVRQEDLEPNGTWCLGHIVAMEVQQ